MPECAHRFIKLEEYENPCWCYNCGCVRDIKDVRDMLEEPVAQKLEEWMLDCQPGHRWEPIEDKNYIWCERCGSIWENGKIRVPRYKRLGG